jgi:predicted flap endonuclease-1-like 5' DNA nuclease
MWFLLLQIFVLLVLAAALGAAATFWWMKRRYEDVTETHDDLLLHADRLKAVSMQTRDDLKSGMENLSASITGLRMPDLAPVNDRLGLLERAVRGISIPEPDLKPLNQRLEVIETVLRAPDIGLDQLRNRMAGLETAIAGMSSSVAPIEARIAGLEDLLLSLKPPEVDLGPVHSGLATLGLTLEDMKTGKTLQPLHGHLDALEARISDMGERLDGARKTDVEALTARVVDLSTAVATLRPLQGMLADIDHAVTQIDRQPVDLQPLHARISELDSALATVKAELAQQHRTALEPVERGVAGLQEALQGMPSPDLDPVLNAIHLVDSRDDLAAVENRLTAIEYSLAALHHMLRSRSEGGLSRAEATWQSRPAPAPSHAPVSNGESRAPIPVVRPPREVDPINPVRRTGDQANLLVEPAFGPPDDLGLINGIGPILSGLLNDTGVYYFWQVAEWSPDEAAWVDSQLMYFKGRIKRDDWVGHARSLATLPTAAKRPMGPLGRI